MSTPTPPVTDTITVVPQPTETLFSLMDTANGLMPTLTPLVAEDKGEVKGEAITEVTPITPLVADTEVISEKIQTPSPLDSPMDSVESLPGEQSPAMTSVGKELARMTRSPRLQGKLIGFISGLEELSNEEELLKNEKRKQIESYMIRISELKMEYETRIHALELEMENLTEQIATMDEEREHITQVIDGFKRELEVV